MLLGILKPLFRDIKTFILDTLFPVYCLVCKNEDQTFLCSQCENILAKSTQVCILCKKPSPAGFTHLSCQTHLSPDGFISLLDYTDKKVSRLIITGKYYLVQDIYSVLGKVLAKYIETDFPFLKNSFTQIPIPLHWTRRNWRGFNQSEILCQEIQNQLSIPFQNLLVRSKITKTQKDLKREARKANVEKVFALNPAIKETEFSIKDKSFVLVDDVVTTGFTILEAAKILKQNGAKTVWCLAVAKD